MGERRVTLDSSGVPGLPAGEAGESSGKGKGPPAIKRDPYLMPSRPSSPTTIPYPLQFFGGAAQAPPGQAPQIQPPVGVGDDRGGSQQEEPLPDGYEPPYNEDAVNGLIQALLPIYEFVRLVVGHANEHDMTRFWSGPPFALFEIEKAARRIDWAVAQLMLQPVAQDAAVYPHGDEILPRSSGPIRRVLTENYGDILENKSQLLRLGLMFTSPEVEAAIREALRYINMLRETSWKVTPLKLEALILDSEEDVKDMFSSMCALFLTRSRLNNPRGWMRQVPTNARVNNEIHGKEQWFRWVYADANGRLRHATFREPKRRRQLTYTPL